MTEKHDIKEEKIINIIKFIKDENAYKKFIDKEKKRIAIFKKQYEFIKKYLSNDLKFINPSKRFQEQITEAKISNRRYKKNFKTNNTEIGLSFTFVDLSKDNNERLFKIEIKAQLEFSGRKYLNNKGWKLRNKKEVRSKLLDALYWTGYEIGKIEMLISELEIQKAIILNDRNILKIDESIEDLFDKMESVKTLKERKELLKDILTDLGYNYLLYYPEYKRIFSGEIKELTNEEHKFISSIFKIRNFKMTREKAFYVLLYRFRNDKDFPFKIDINNINDTKTLNEYYEKFNNAYKSYLKRQREREKYKKSKLPTKINPEKIKQTYHRMKFEEHS